MNTNEMLRLSAIQTTRDTLPVATNKNHNSICSNNKLIRQFAYLEMLMRMALAHTTYVPIRTIQREEVLDEHRQLWFLNPFRIMFRVQNTNEISETYVQTNWPKQCVMWRTCILSLQHRVLNMHNEFWRKKKPFSLSQPRVEINIFCICAERTMHWSHMFWPFLAGLVSCGWVDIFAMFHRIREKRLRNIKFSFFSFGIININYY